MKHNTINDDTRAFLARFGGLNQLSWKLNELRNEEEIHTAALQDTPRLVAAESAVLWLWDADQAAPVVAITADNRAPVSDLPASLLTLFRQAVNGCQVQLLDAADSQADWPATLTERAVACVPLCTPRGCLGLLTIRHRPDAHFSADDCSLLAFIGNAIAIAYQNARQHLHERRLIELLQTLIRRVARASSGQPAQQKDFIQALVQFAQGVTRADTAGVYLTADADAPPTILASGPWSAAARQVAPLLADALRHRGPGDTVLTGELCPLLPPETCPEAQPSWHYAAAEITVGNKGAGALFVLQGAPLAEEQRYYLRTITEQLGEGIGNIQQAANIQRLLFELSNVNFVAEEITRTFDPQRISAIICDAASQGLTVPIVMCGWRQDDGSILVYPNTQVGLEPALWAQFRLVENNAAIREVLRLRTSITSRSKKKRESHAFPFLTTHGVQDWICIPMVVQPRVPGESPRARGVLLAADVQPRVFSDHEVALLETYANQGALATENCQLLDEVCRQLRQMDLLYTVAREIGSTLEIPAILDRLLQAATEALQLPAALVTLTDEDLHGQQAARVFGIDDTWLPRMKWSPGEGIIGMVAQREEPIASINLISDGRAPLLREMAMQEGLTSSDTIPLAGREGMQGTLTVFSRTTRIFTATERQLLHTLALEAAGAIQNARVYLREQHRTHELSGKIDKLLRQTPAAFEIMLDLLNIVPPGDVAPPDRQRMRQRIDCLLTTVRAVSIESPLQVNMKDAMKLLIHRRHHEQEGEPWSAIHVLGASVNLPLREGLALAVFLHEWLLALHESPATARAHLQVAFQQTGNEALAQIESSTAPTVPPSANLLPFLQHYLPGEMTATTEPEVHRIRYRFIRP